MCAHNPSHNKRRITTILAALLSTLAVLMPTFRSMASTPEAQGYVEFKFNERTVWVDQPFQVNVDVVNAEDWELPRIPEIDGMTSQVLPNPRLVGFPAPYGRIRWRLVGVVDLDLLVSWSAAVLVQASA